AEVIAANPDVPHARVALLVGTTAGRLAAVRYDREIDIGLLGPVLGSQFHLELPGRRGAELGVERGEEVAVDVAVAARTQNRPIRDEAKGDELWTRPSTARGGVRDDTGFKRFDIQARPQRGDGAARRTALTPVQETHCISPPRRTQLVV